jgi:hypothetical protein
MHGRVYERGDAHRITSWEDPAMERLLTSTSNEFEAEVIVGRLVDAGIAGEVRGQIQTRSGGYVQGGRDVFVEEDQLDRARSVLSEAEGVSEDELARLAEEAGREGHAAQD